MSRGDLLTDTVIRTVFAIADGDSGQIPPVPENLTNSEAWGMTCAALEMIRHLGGWVGRDWYAAKAFSLDGTTVPQHLHLVAQLIGKYASGDTTDAMTLFFSAPLEVATKANTELFLIAGGLVRDKEQRRASDGSNP